MTANNNDERNTEVFGGRGFIDVTCSSGRWLVTNPYILGKTPHSKFKGKDAQGYYINMTYRFELTGLSTWQGAIIYWLTEEDSARLIADRHYAVAPDAQLAAMVISDRISAFDCIWHGEGGLTGVPGKGALNAISYLWFAQFQGAG